MTTQLKPWGTHKVVFDGDNFKVKYICVEKGKSISLQKHFNRSESWVVLTGHPVVTKGKCKILLKPEDSIYIPKEEIHRIEATHDNVQIIEVQQGICEETDIERISDEYGRA
tara:strand:+ start:296 stop:631 length:336 start_codon:yes stop_codon:yes gene_type:complete